MDLIFNVPCGHSFHIIQWKEKHLLVTTIVLRQSLQNMETISGQGPSSFGPPLPMASPNRLYTTGIRITYVKSTQLQLPLVCLLFS